jgi:hypothetical protein
MLKSAKLIQFTENGEIAKTGRDMLEMLKSAKLTQSFERNAEIGKTFRL